MAEANKEVKTEVKKEKVVKQEKPKLLMVSEQLFGFAEKSKLFKGGAEEVDKQILATFKAAGQTVNIKGKLITPERVSSQRRAWMGDVKNERQGRWASVKLVDNKEGLQFKMRA